MIDTVPELLISIRQIGEQELLVRVERCPEGVTAAEERLAVPFEQWCAQAEALGYPQQGTLRGLGTQALLKRPPSLTPLQLGQGLFNGLFQRSIATSLQQSLAVVRSRRQPLRLRLCLAERRLAALPWELLHDGTRELAAAREVWLSRCDWRSWIDRHFPNPDRTDEPRIVAALSEPTDRARLGLAQEAEFFRLLFADFPRHLQPQTLFQPDRRALTDALQAPAQVWHYAGHSDTCYRGGVLELVGDSGRAEAMSGEEIGGLLERAGVRLVVLNSCRGAALDGEESLAEVLLRRGVGGVVAMADRIDNDVALAFMQAFYRGLCDGEVIDQAAGSARQQLLSKFSGHLPYWSLPVVYLHPQFNGRLTLCSEADGIVRQQKPGWSRPFQVGAALLVLGAIAVGATLKGPASVPLSDEGCRALLEASQKDRSLAAFEHLLADLRRGGCSIPEYRVVLVQKFTPADPTRLQPDAEGATRGGNPVQEALQSGDAAAENRQWSQAIEHYLSATQISAQPEAIWLRIGIVYTALGQTAQAEQAYRRALNPAF